MHNNIDNLLKKADNCNRVAEIAYNEGCYDDSISRYYYSAYYKMQYIVEKNKKKVQVNSKSSHINMHEAIKEIANKNRGMSSKAKLCIAAFPNIKDFRQTADYKKEVISKEKFEVAFKPRYTDFNNALNEMLK